MHIFYYTGGKFGEVAGVFSLEKHSPDAGLGGIGCSTYAFGVLLVSGASEKCASYARIGRRADTVRTSSGA